MKKKIIILSSVAICTALIVIGATFSYFTSEDSVTNVFNTGSIEAVPKEEYELGTTMKKVWVENTGKNDCLVRVSITPRWVDKDGKPWAGDVSSKVVELVFNTDNIVTGPVDSNLTSDKWIKGEDQYYYYTSKLPVGKTTTELLSSVNVKINEDTVYNLEDYDGKFLKVDVKVEAVQTTQDAYKTVWDMDLAGDTISNLLYSITPR